MKKGARNDLSKFKVESNRKSIDNKRIVLEILMLYLKGKTDDTDIKHYNIAEFNHAVSRSIKNQSLYLNCINEKSFN